MQHCYETDFLHIAQRAIKLATALCFEYHGYKPMFLNREMVLNSFPSQSTNLDLVLRLLFPCEEGWALACLSAAQLAAGSEPLQVSG